MVPQFHELRKEIEDEGAFASFGKFPDPLRRVLDVSWKVGMERLGCRGSERAPVFG